MIRTEWQAERELDYLHPDLAAERDRHEAAMAELRRNQRIEQAAARVAEIRSNALRWCAILRNPAAHGYPTDRTMLVSIAATRAGCIRDYLRNKAWAVSVQEDV